MKKMHYIEAIIMKKTLKKALKLDKRVKYGTQKM